MIKFNKIITAILIFICGIIIFFIDQKLFGTLKIAPSLFLIYLTFIYLNTNLKIGLIFGTVYLYIFDAFLNINPVSSILAIYISLMVLEILKNTIFKKNNKVNSIILISIITILFETLRTFIQIKFLNFEFIKILCVEIILNSVITFLLYDISKPFREKLNEVFSKFNILTRYF